MVLDRVDVGRVLETETPAGTIKSFLPPGNNSSYGASLAAVPGLGEHTRSILEELQFSGDEIQQFFENEIV